jgi:small subunit ribosomal protein S16
MSITIRLTKTGRKNFASFRIVVANTRSKRNGVFLDTLGTYDPSHNPVVYKLDKEKLDSWKAKGAFVTEAVKKLVDGTYKFVKYSPKKAKAGEAKATEPKAEATPEA